MKNMLKLLIVEDEQTLSDNIKEIIQPLDEITQAFDGETGLFEGQSNIYDVILLDLMLPEINGYEVLAKLREQNIQTPVLILTAKDGIDDKVTGFQKGADDYLTKPFYREELLLRVKALLKRSLGLYEESILSYGPISCNLQSNQVTFQETVLPIQGKEFELLVYFIQNKGVILTKEQIFDRIWGFDSDTTITVVEVYMSHLRKHLKPTGIANDFKTLRNVGYLLQEQG